LGENTSWETGNGNGAAPKTVGPKEKGNALKCLDGATRKDCDKRKTREKKNKRRNTSGKGANWGKISSEGIKKRASVASCSAKGRKVIATFRKRRNQEKKIDPKGWVKMSRRLPQAEEIRGRRETKKRARQM